MSAAVAAVSAASGPVSAATAAEEQGGSLRNAAVARLREMISSGDLPSAHSFTEASICEQLGMSRAPVREALVLLSHLGWVTSQPRAGYQVVPPTLNELRELGEMRALLEPRAAALAATRIDPAGADAAALREFSDGPDADPEAQRVRHYRYHRRISVAARSREIDRTLTETLLRLGRYLRLPAVRTGAPLDGIGHRTLTDAIMSRDPEAAASAAAERVRHEQAIITAAIVDSDIVGTMPLPQ